MSFTKIYVPNPNGKNYLIKEHTLVQKHVHTFYDSLYSYRQCHESLDDVKRFLEGVELKSVPKGYNAEQNCPISTLEIAQYLKTLSNNKAPGISGITGAFYKFFWKNLSHQITLA